MQSDSLRELASHYAAKHLRFNVAVNVLDGAFFGSALGIASFVTVIPLFVNTLTSSAILIGLIPALHTIGWQLPQLFTAGTVSRLLRYKPMVLAMTIHERVPYLGLAVVALFSQTLNPNLALAIVFLLLMWQGLGGGLAATAWQSMIGKIIPPRHHGKFFGMQSATANLFASVAALIAGIILLQIGSPVNFALCFFLAAVGMGISYIFLTLTRETEHALNVSENDLRSIWKQAGTILRRDRNFSWFVAARFFAQFAIAATAFYTIYATRTFGMNPETAGLMTSILLATQVVANPIMGALGDKLGHRTILVLGTFAALLAPLIAWASPGLEWFYLVYILTGVGNVALWTISIAMTLEFGGENERPVYVGLANTLLVPASIAAPILGGWIADAFGYQTMFMFSVICAAITAIIFQFFMHNVHAPQNVARAK